MKWVMWLCFSLVSLICHANLKNGPFKWQNIQTFLIQWLRRNIPFRQSFEQGNIYWQPTYIDIDYIEAHCILRLFTIHKNNLQLYLNNYALFFNKQHKSSLEITRTKRHRSFQVNSVQIITTVNIEREEKSCKSLSVSLIEYCQNHSWLILAHCLVPIKKIQHIWR